MQRTKEQAADLGYVETLFGRRLYLPNIHAKNATVRAGAERAAINAPMQGTASDLIKRAMIETDNFLFSGGLKTRLIMQVHDELVLEMPKSEREIIITRLPEIMADVGRNVLNVPLLAEVGIGVNWDAAH